MVITITGENQHAARQELERLASEFAATHGELAVHRLDAESADLAAISDAALGGSLLAPASLTILRDVSSNKTLQPAVLDIIPQVPDENILVILEPAPDRRTTFFKDLAKLTELKDFKNLSENELVGWAIDQAKARGATLSRPLANQLVQRAGTDQWRLSHELDKLAAHDELTPELIDELVEPSPTESIFQLLDAITQGDTRRAAELYAGLRAQQLEPQYVLGMIAWQLHALALVRTAGERTPGEIAKEAKLSPYVVGKLKRPASRLTLPALKKLFRLTAETDVATKSTGADPDLLVEQLIAKLTAQF